MPASRTFPDRERIVPIEGTVRGVYCVLLMDYHDEPLNHHRLPPRKRRRQAQRRACAGGARAVTEVVRPLHYPRTDRAVEQTPVAALAPERRSTVRSQRRLVTVVFFDLVQSTRTALQLGDRAWCDLLRRFYDEADHLVSAAEGRVVKTTGDGFLAVFDSPSDAVRAAIATRNAVNELGLDRLAVGFTPPKSSCSVTTSSASASTSEPGSPRLPTTTRCGCRARSATSSPART